MLTAGTQCMRSMEICSISPTDLHVAIVIITTPTLDCYIQLMSCARLLALTTSVSRSNVNMITVVPLHQHLANLICMAGSMPAAAAAAATIHAVIMLSLSTAHY